MTHEQIAVEYIRYQVPGPRHEEFLAAYRTAAEDLACAPECLHCEVSEGVEEPDNFVVRIEWASVNAHEHGFRNGSNVAPFFAKVKPFFTNIREMKHYVVAIESQGTGGK
jgi:heme-degrading monooxygenase HmoA